MRLNEPTHIVLHLALGESNGLLGDGINESMTATPATSGCMLQTGKNMCLTKHEDMTSTEWWAVTM